MAEQVIPAVANAPTGPITPPAPPQVQNDAATIAKLQQDLEAKDAALKGFDAKFKAFEQTMLSPEFLEFQAKKARGGEAEPPVKPGDQPADIDWDSMTNAEMAQTITGLVAKEVQKAITPIQQQSDHADIKAQIQEAAAALPDFWDYKDAMAQLAERMPNSSPKTLYYIVKGVETTTGKSLKQAPSDQAGGDVTQRPNARAANRPASGEFGSGPPRSGGRAPEKQPSSYAEAAGDAYDEIFGQ